ncbi:hypothetical protein OV079_30165 [Nannocystis pusilla]|uniref:Uncharacterized protein n=1 Tax=Nannocystis pusilla TaxID=889268 RepID=A0A9X3F1K7_9BACT|nr:hypothetical protein [Nannocystis pusilla]MCY1009753.1 hypothetical protein [Nannocystis pusilla]
MLVLGLRHSHELPLPYYRPHLLAGFWLELTDGVVWFDNDQGVLTPTPAARLQLPDRIDRDSAEDMCILGGEGFTLDRAREPAPIAALELIAEDDAALREARIAAVFLRCTDGAELFAHAWSFEGVAFGRAPEYTTWREEQPYSRPGAASAGSPRTRRGRGPRGRRSACAREPAGATAARRRTAKIATTLTRTIARARS